MSTLGNENLRAPIEKLRKRAYSIQSRMKELGHQVSLAHSYEVLATSSGFRNWPTMKAKAESSQPALEIGRELDAENGAKVLTISAADCLDHIEVVGQHGANRTQVIAGIAAGAIEKGEGLVYLDAGGDPSLPGRLRTLAGRHGRADDVQVISLLASPFSQSVPYNPFASASAEELAEILVHLPTPYEDGVGPDDIWRKRSESMMIAILRPLVWLRDSGKITLSPKSLVDHLKFDLVLSLSRDHEGIPSEVVGPLRGYLASLPRFEQESGLNQPQTTLDHHGYLTLIFIKPLLLLSEVYGHIFDRQENLSSIDETISRGKILLVAFPYAQNCIDAFGGILRMFYLDLVHALKRRDRSIDRKMVTAVVDNCEGFLPGKLNETLAAATDGNGCLVFGWEQSPRIPVLKKSVSVYMLGKDPTVSTVVTKTGRHRVVTRNVDF